MKTSSHTSHLSRILEILNDPGSSGLDENEFNRLALTSFNFQYRVNLIYRRFCNLLPRSYHKPRTWKEIPSLPVAAFKYGRGAVHTASRDKAGFVTSGTTFERRGRHVFARLAFYDAAIRILCKRHL